MKKFLNAMFCILVMCVMPLGLFGCGDSAIDGEYYLTEAVAQTKGSMMYYLTSKDEAGIYENVSGGMIVPENFWVEIKDGKFTVHGSITPVAGERISFHVNQENVREFTYALQTGKSNENWYDVYSNGEDTFYSVSADGKSLVFQFGKPGDEYWYNVSYDKK